MTMQVVAVTSGGGGGGSDACKDGGPATAISSSLSIYIAITPPQSPPLLNGDTEGRSTVKKG
jgi:hypothetical protein